MISIRVEHKKKALPLFKEALENRLFVPGWQAQKLFTSLVDGTEYVSFAEFEKGAELKHVSLAMMYDNKTPIAWVLYWHDVRYSITNEYWRFTKGDYRKNGYSSKLRKAMQESLHVQTPAQNSRLSRRMAESASSGF